MTHYHVFLPPPTLSALSSDDGGSGVGRSAVPGIKVHILPCPAREAASASACASQASLSERLVVAVGLSALGPPIKLSKAGFDHGLGKGLGHGQDSGQGRQAQDSSQQRAQNLGQGHGHGQQQAQGYGISVEPTGRRTRRKVNARDGVEDESFSSTGFNTADASQGGQAALVSPDAGGGRRRSRRIARSSGSSIDDALPHIMNTNDSLLSLNTTTSDPSQFPPSAADRSVHNLPRWHIPLARLTTLSALTAVTGKPDKHKPDKHLQDKGDKAVVSVLVCVVAVEAATVVRRRDAVLRTRAAGRGGDGDLWMGVWHVVEGGTGEADEAGISVRLWGDMARDWGDRVRRGDVVLLENVEFRPATSKAKAEMVLSTSFGARPKPTIVYRTMPRPAPTSTSTDRPGRRANGGAADGGGRSSILPEDRLLRPDLRLARSDAGIRRVADCARWFAGWIGGEPPP